MTIEYEYTRVYLNSLALHAIVERCIHSTPIQQHMALRTSEQSGPNSVLTPHQLSKFCGEDDRKLIDEVVDGCRTVLKEVVTNLGSQSRLMFCSVRTYFRIISVAVILLKTFACGGTGGDLTYSLGLMEDAIVTLRTCIVDDVHIGNSFADMCETLVSRIKQNIIRFPKGGSSNESRAQSPSLAANSTQGQSTMMNICRSGQFNVPLASQAGATQWNTALNNNNSASNPVMGGVATGMPNGQGDYITSSSAAVTPNQMIMSGGNGMGAFSAETYNPNTHAMIPPPGNYDSKGNFDFNWGLLGDGGDGSDSGQLGSGGADANWFGLNLLPMLQANDQNVTNSTLGPDVGGQDT